ncbi:MAG: PEP/pyruvate-binding domain-containing protein [Planctomycetota bacterium]
MTDSKRHVFYVGEALDEPPVDPRELFGGKAASLHAMRLAGLPVPPAFVISTECCRHVLDNDGRWPDGLEQEVGDHLARLEQETGRTYGRGPKPLLLSVRSGAAVSMPGMMDTLLNCGLSPSLAETAEDADAFWASYVEFILAYGDVVNDLRPGELADVETEPVGRESAERLMKAYRQRTAREFPTDPWQVLVECINAVFRSWNSRRATAYRKRHDITDLAGTAVTVQAMFPSQVSGVLFTQDPNDPATERMVIEAAEGLGVAVVSGDVTPERASAPRHNLRGIDMPAQRKTSLSRKQFIELCQLARRAEKHFGMPLDIEWAMADGQFVLLQARAIRGLAVAADVEPALHEEIRHLAEIADGGRRLWVIHNLDETLRFPTPLTWDIVRQFMSADGGFGRMYRDFGYQPARELADNGFLELVGGRIYSDPQRLARFFWGKLPMAYDLDAIAADPKELARAAARFDPARAEGAILFKLPGVLWSMLKSLGTVRKAVPLAKRRFEDDIVPPYLDYVGQKRSEDLTGLSAEAILAELEDRCRRVLTEFGAESLKPGYLGGLAWEKLVGVLTQLGGPEDGPALASELVVGLEGDISFEQDAMLYRAAIGEAKLEDFLDAYGHRAVGEMELSRPRWRDNAEFLNTMLEQMARAPRSPEDIHRDNIERRREAHVRLVDTLARWGGRSMLEDVEAHLAVVRELLPYRENGKHYLMMGTEVIREAIGALGDRLGLGDDVFYLTRPELQRFDSDPQTLRQTIERRKVRRQAVQRLDLPDVIDSYRLDDLAEPRGVEATDALKGTAIAPGMATGPVRVVLDPAEAEQLGTGYVLVCPTTDPGWTPLFLNACGLIVERGGALSHGAIVARDFGIPAVVCPGATRSLADGDIVQVDGRHGRVAIVEGGAAVWQ